MSEDVFTDHLATAQAAIYARIKEHAAFNTWQAEKSVSQQGSMLYNFLKGAHSPAAFVVWNGNSFDEAVADCQTAKTSWQIFCKIQTTIQAELSGASLSMFKKVGRALQGFRPLPDYWGPLEYVAEAPAELPIDDIIVRVFMLEMRCEIHEDFAADVNE